MFEHTPIRTSNTDGNFSESQIGRGLIDDFLGLYSDDEDLEDFVELMEDKGYTVKGETEGDEGNLIIFTNDDEDELFSDEAYSVSWKIFKNGTTLIYNCDYAR